MCLQIIENLSDFGGIYFGVIYSNTSLAEEVTSCLAFSLILYESQNINRRAEWVHPKLNTFWMDKKKKKKKEMGKRGGNKSFGLGLITNFPYWCF